MTTSVTPRPPTVEAVKALRRRALAEMSKVLRQRRHRRLWRDAESFEQLCALGERFVLGQLSLTPGHGGPRMPETREIGPALAHANRAGFLTIGSQPGEENVEHGWRQRAAVEGHANDEVMEKLRAVFADARASGRITMTVQSTYPWRNDYSTAEVVSYATNVDFFWGTDWGARLSKGEIVRMWGGIADHLIDEILGMNLICIMDTKWGPETLLWERLMLL